MITAQALKTRLLQKATLLSKKTQKDGYLAYHLAKFLNRLKFETRKQHGVAAGIDYVGIVDGYIGVGGWILPPKRLAASTTIELYLNETLVGNAPFGDLRTDLREKYPFIHSDWHCGFHVYAALPDTLPASERSYALRLKMTSRDGQCWENVFPFENDYSLWMQRNEPGASELEGQRRANFSYAPLISLITPGCNTPEKFLLEMLESLLKQTYTHWELCFADGASQDAHVKKILTAYAEKDSRIRTIFLPENEGIAGNSNAALSLASGEYIGLLDHDDTLPPWALFELVKCLNAHPKSDYVYSDEDLLSEDGLMRYDPYFKPDWSPETLRSMNYPTHFSIFRHDLIDQLHGFREGFDGSQDYDVILRATERAREIRHIPKILYHWRMHNSSLARNIFSKTYAYDSAKKALREHLERQGIAGKVEDAATFGFYKVSYTLKTHPRISIIIIQDRSHTTSIQHCVKSIVKKSSYRNFEVLLVRHEESENDAFPLPQKLNAHQNVQGINAKQATNSAAARNLAAQKAGGEILLFLHPKLRALNADWLERMCEHALRKEIGAVGAKLYSPTHTIQHAGIVLGVHGSAAHGHQGISGAAAGYKGRLLAIQNVSAVSGACLMLRKDVFQEVNGFDERYQNALYDIDLCLKIRQKAYRIVWTPYAELSFTNTKQQEHSGQDIRLFQQTWADLLQQGDPYYNPNLTLERKDFSIAIH